MVPPIPEESASASTRTPGDGACDTPLSTLCAHCRSLFERPNEEIDTDIEAASKVIYHEAPSTTTTENCSVCVTIHKYTLGQETQPPARSLVSASTTTVPYLNLFIDIVYPDKVYPILAMQFFASAPGSNTPAIKLDPDYHTHGCESTAVVPSLAQDNTKDEQCFHVVRRWLHTCMHDHKLCNRTSGDVKSLYVPTRLIDLREGLRVIETRFCHMSERRLRYATLSHKWRKDGSLRLLQSNLDAFLERIEPGSLPPVFNDAVEVAQRLGIDYIWIDALCIVQDDADDWAKEAAMMGSVYQNAMLNIGASAAAEAQNTIVTKRRTSKDELDDHTPGLFVRREISDSAMSHVNITRRGYAGLHHGFATELLLDRHYARKIMERGWILQERTLSPRSIYFDEQLTWECSELLANESFPQGSPGPTLIGGFERNRPLRLASLLHGASDPATEYTSGIVINYTYRTWLYLVETYRHCRLTYTSDTLPALAGLAKEFQVELEDDYLVGLWRKDVMRGLLWNRCVEHCRRIAYSPLATYRAPSWSWASTDLSVMFAHIWDIYPSRIEQFVAEVHDVTVTAVSNITGPITHGCLAISGMLVPNKNSPIDSTAHYDFETGHKSTFEAYDWEVDEKGIPGCVDSSFLILTFCTMPTNLPPEIGPLIATPMRVRGLIVKPTGNLHEYRRVGAFQLDPTERSEFADLDFENLEKQRITIV